MSRWPSLPSAAVVVGGVVCGTWARKGDELMIAWRDERPRPDGPIRKEAERLSVVLGRDLRVSLT